MIMLPKSAGEPKDRNLKLSYWALDKRYSDKSPTKNGESKKRKFCKLTLSFAVYGNLGQFVPLKATRCRQMKIYET